MLRSVVGEFHTADESLEEDPLYKLVNEITSKIVPTSMPSKSNPAEAKTF